MKKSKKNYLIIALIVILLALAVGYAGFTQNLQITGTATAKVNWDIHFENATTSNATIAAMPTLTDNNHKMNVSVNLKKPGDTATVTVDIVNKGSVDATLTGFTITAENGQSTPISGTGGVYTEGAIKMTLQELTTNTELVNTTGKLTYTMTFEWPSDYNTESVDDTANFVITFDYSQKNV